MEITTAIGRMTREEALAIYRQGEEFVVFKLMELDTKLSETMMEV